jgi:hypothetical protein
MIAAEGSMNASALAAGALSSQVNGLVRGGSGEDELRRAPVVGQ